MDKRIPEVIQPMLQAYVDLLNRELPDFVEAVYLHGSIALDAFDEQRSDIDTITVISRPANENDVQKLTSLHKTLASQYRRWLLEVSYLQAADLGQSESAIQPHPIYHDNKLDSAGHFDVNPVTWWLLKNKGIAILGADAQQLPFEASWDTLLGYMHENINSYWASFTTNPMRMMRNLPDDGVAWVVLGVLRQYYSFREQDITSKVGAGEYGLKHAPAEWHPLIQDALAIRQGQEPSNYSSRFTRAYAVVRFVRYVIDESNQLTQAGQTSRNG
ncbi:MAG: DUF4111 domain-containing protein [Anaerolineaceae bacterium]|nr:DUF4111 domain-containing protein [Anaerolineaceae bacterium]